MFIAIERTIDKYIGTLVVSIIGLFTKKSRTIPYSTSKNEYPKKILIIKLWAIGDSINTLPAIASLKEQYPKTAIHILCRKANEKAYSNQKNIDKIILLEITSFFNVLKLFRSYDICIDTEPFLNISTVLAWWSAKNRIGFDHNIRRKCYTQTIPFQKETHIAEMYLNMAQCAGVNKTSINAIKKQHTLIPLQYSKENEQAVIKILKEHNINVSKQNKKIKLIGICASVGLMVKEREWPKEKFRAVCNKILDQQKNTLILLIGTKEDNILNEYIKDNNQKIINLAGKFTLEQLFAFMHHLDLFISNDTGPMHIAAAQGVKTIGLFGPNTPKIWGPYGLKNIALFHPKKGCPFLNNCTHQLVPKKLTKEQQICMDAISVEEVLKHT